MGEHRRLANWSASRAAASKGNREGVVPIFIGRGAPLRDTLLTPKLAVLPMPLAADDTLRKAGGMIKARAVPVPSDSVLAPLYVGADLLDAFAIHLPSGASDDLEVLARALFERQAGWIRALTWVRDAVMATVGVKSSRAIGSAAAARGSAIGYFPLRRVRGSWWWARTTGISTSESRSCCARARRAGGR